MVETSQSYNPEVHYKHQIALCNNYSALSEKISNWIMWSENNLGVKFYVCAVLLHSVDAVLGSGGGSGVKQDVIKHNCVR